MSSPLDTIRARRAAAMHSLVDRGYLNTRVYVGMATCEIAAGSKDAWEVFQQALKAGRIGDTYLSIKGCAGRCNLEPMVEVVEPGKIPVKYVNVSPERAQGIIERHLLGGQAVREWTIQALDGGGTSDAAYAINICHGRSCGEKNSAELREALEKAAAEAGAGDKVRIVPSGCLGLCADGPVLVVHPGCIVYGHVKPADAAEIIRSHILKGKPVTRLLLEDHHLYNRFYRIYGDVHFFGKQMRATLRNCGIIDPESLDEYLAVNGYEALGKVLTSMSPEKVVDEMKRSGLRGRGGAGFPTGLKWELTAKQPGAEKYVICNADEGDPGAFMDRSTIEGDPHSIVEGMAIGGYAIGASKGIVYIRAEYPLAIVRLEKAIADARRAGLLGKDILGSGFSFDIEIRLGAGAFVCGEETALIHSVEGQRGMPRPKPPFPSVAGVYGKPTVINNVETWANIPVVIMDGASWFSSIGTARSKGTKVFALAGNVRNTGLVEVPMGTTLRDIVYDVGGGIQNDRKFKSVQTGGPSGGCLPERFLDTPIDYESLAQAGSIMGSGGMIVVDENTCMVNLAKFFLEFTHSESCGKCVPCREGIKAMHGILDRISRGEGKLADLDRLEKMAKSIKRSALCGLGQSAPNPVLSTLQYFREEYVQHIVEKKCVAGVCKDLAGAPCQSTCPLGTEAWRYIAHVARQEYEEAYKVLREPNPMPATCGRVCHHPCEVSCRAGRSGGQSISIRNLKRFVTDRVDPSKAGIKVPRAGKDAPRAAVVGGGPAGISAAHHLALQGFQVTLFEAEQELGGVLRCGIPAYRLPREVLQKEIDGLLAANVKVECGKALGRDFSLDDLQQKQGFKAVFLALGAHQSLKLEVEGEEIEGVYPSMAFLKGHNLHGRKLAKGRVGIVGGGNSAPDSARTSLRQGADSVTIFYRRSRREMPVFAEEIEEALGEGVKLETHVAPTRIIAKDGRLAGVEFVRNRLGAPDASGRRRPEPIPGSEHVVPLDTLIVAISEKPDQAVLAASGLKLTTWNTVEVDKDTLQTSRPGVFAGGDVVSGPYTVVDALAAGKRAALMIGRQLRGEAMKVPAGVVLPEVFVPQTVLERGEDEPEPQRPHPPMLAKDKRKGNFDEIEKALPEAVAVEEARRCLRCDLDFTRCRSSSDQAAK